jgi:acyl dehydratase
MDALDPGQVGRTAGPLWHDVDARWLMAYAAALGETGPEYFDTRRRDGLVGHPVFPVAYEWPAAQALRTAAFPAAVADRAVHRSHDLRIHRPPRAGDRLATTATLRAVEPRSAGAHVLLDLVTADASGAPVTTTAYGVLYRGVGVAGGGPRAPAGPAAPPAPPGDWSEPIAIAATLGHVYGECARIWNPIHTDRAVAGAAGLPGPILHGTATLALAVSAVLRHLGAPAARVRRVAGRFGAMVLLPSTITVRGRDARPGPAGLTVSFDTLAEDGRPAIRDGQLVLALPG